VKRVLIDLTYDSKLATCLTPVLRFSSKYPKSRFETNDQIIQKLVEEFVSLTANDEALAQLYLQDRNWNLQNSVNDNFDHVSKRDKKSHRDVKSLTVTAMIAMIAIIA